MAKPAARADVDRALDVGGVVGAAEGASTWGTIDCTPKDRRLTPPAA